MGAVVSQVQVELQPRKRQAEPPICCSCSDGGPAKASRMVPSAKSAIVACSILTMRCCFLVFGGCGGRLKATVAAIAGFQEPCQICHQHKRNSLAAAKMQIECRMYARGGK